MKRWYVVNTKSNQETLAASELKENGFKAFFPRYIKHYSHPKTKTVSERELALFPSYVFVQFDAQRNRRWQNIERMKGIIGLVGLMDDYLCPVPVGCIEEIIARCDRKGLIKLEETVKKVLKFHPNMPLYIKKGMFQGQVATYCNSSDNRVTLLLALLSKPLKLILPIDAVAELPSLR